MPKPFPKECRDDVMATPRRREASFAQIANDSGISESCAQRWARLAKIDQGIKPRTTTSEVALAP